MFEWILQEPQLPLTARVTGYVTPTAATGADGSSKRAILYSVETTNGKESWTVSPCNVTIQFEWCCVSLVVTFAPQVYCRYSEFSALHDLLKEQCPTFKGALPPKRRFFGEDAKFLENRRVALARWMEEVMQNRYTKLAFEVVTFLSKRSKVADVGVDITGNIQSILSVVAAPIVVPSRKLINMFGIVGTARTEVRDTDGVTESKSGEGDDGDDDNGGDEKRPLQARAKRATAEFVSKLLPKPPKRGSSTRSGSGNTRAVNDGGASAAAGSGVTRAQKTSPVVEPATPSLATAANPFAGANAHSSGVTVAVGSCGEILSWISVTSGGFAFKRCGFVLCRCVCGCQWQGRRRGEGTATETGHSAYEVGARSCRVSHVSTRHYDHRFV